MKIAEESLKLSQLFEAELLIELMLRFWNHPLADDEAFRNHLLECASETLKLAVHGEHVIKGLKPENLNLVAAVWSVEASFVDSPQTSDSQYTDERRQWLDRLRQSVPSCFCDPEYLD